MTTQGQKSMSVSCNPSVPLCEPAKIRFKTSSEPYNKIYHKWDKTQADLENKTIERYVNLIEQRYHQINEPISILDIGCGYGKQAYHIKKILEQRGVKIAKVYGYDISPELIEVANEKYGSEPNLTFFKKNLDTQFDDVDEFDVIISFLALHWVNDIKSVCKSIGRSLKVGGLCLAQIGLELRGLYKCRAEFLRSSEWSSSFDPASRTVSSIYQTEDVYLDELKKHLYAQCEEVRVLTCRLTQSQAVVFTANWIPEVRTLLVGITDEPRRKAIMRAYTTDLIESIPEGVTQDIEKTEEGILICHIRTINYEGVKLE